MPRRAPAPARPLATTLHEAAHVVVAYALGLRVSRARVGARDAAGDVEILYTPGSDDLACAIALAAGVAWERRAPRGVPADAEHDARAARALVGREAYETCVRLAGLVLETRGVALRRVARALATRDLCADDFELLVHGRTPPAEREE